MPKQNSDENRSLASGRKIQTLIQQLVREEYMDKYPRIVRSSFGKGVAYGALTSLSECRRT